MMMNSTNTDEAWGPAGGSSSTLVALSSADLSFGGPGSTFETGESSRVAVSTSVAVEVGPSSTFDVAEPTSANSSVEAVSSTPVTAVASTFEVGGSVPSNLGIPYGASVFSIQPLDLNHFSQEFRGLLNSSIEEFHVNPSRFTRLEHMLGAAFLIRKDRAGSRLVEHCLEEARDAEKALFLMEIIPHVCYLAAHQYGNFVIQKFIMISDSLSQIYNLGNVLSHSIPVLSCNQFGYHVVLKLLYKASQIYNDHRTLVIIMREIVLHVLPLASHHLGNYVVQAVIRLGYARVNADVIERLMDHNTLMVHICGEFAHHVYRCLMVSCNFTQLIDLMLQLYDFLDVHGVHLRQSQLGLEVVRFVRHLINVGWNRLNFM